MHPIPGPTPYGPANSPGRLLSGAEFAVPEIGANLARFEQREHDSTPTRGQRIRRRVVIALVFLPLVIALVMPLIIR